jgi:hypothetical protein
VGVRQFLVVSRHLETALSRWEEDGEMFSIVAWDCECVGETRLGKLSFNEHEMIFLGLLVEKTSRFSYSFVDRLEETALPDVPALLTKEPARRWGKSSHKVGNGWVWKINVASAL